jgi:septal ring factor EnvC (AmiA/AmiB activator)
LPRSDTPVGEQSAVSNKRSAISSQQSETALVDACAAAVEDLKATRALADSLTAENAALKSRLETEKQTSALLSELNETRKSETESLRAAIAAGREALAAKDSVIASQDKLIEALKKKRSSPWQRLGDVLIGAAVFAILK